MLNTEAIDIIFLKRNTLDPQVAHSRIRQAYMRLFKTLFKNVLLDNFINLGYIFLILQGCFPLQKYARVFFFFLIHVDVTIQPALEPWRVSFVNKRILIGINSQMPQLQTSCCLLLLMLLMMVILCVYQVNYICKYLLVRILQGLVCRLWIVYVCVHV